MATEPDPHPESDHGHERVGEHVRLFRRGTTWYANFQFHKRQHRVSLGTTNKKEARRRAAQIDVKLTAGQWVPAVDAVTVRAAADAYLDVLAADGRAAKTMTKYRHVLGRVVQLAERRRVREVAGLDLSFLDAYRKWRTDAGAAPKTKYTECVILRQLILFAVSRNLVAADPMKGVRLPKPKPTKQPCWTRAEVRAILSAADDATRPALTVLAEAGVRFGEMQWLTWDDVDFTANVLTVQPKDGWAPKTGDRRVVPMSAALRALLESLPRESRWVVPMPPSRTCPESGRQWTERRLLARLKQILARLKLPGKLHTFRHAFISNALTSDPPTPVAVVRAWVGHVDPHVIDLYTHVHDTASQAAMQRLSQSANPSASEDGPDELKATNPAQK